MSQTTGVTQPKGVSFMVARLIREFKVTQFPEGAGAWQMLKALLNRYLQPQQSTYPGYICVVRKDNLVRFSLTRKPRRKAGRLKRKDEAQELVWYGFTENMPATKQEALRYFEEYRTEGDWLRITPLMAMIYLKRLSGE